MSDITLTAGMRANLLSLQQTSVLMARTQMRLATGKAVNSSVDDAAKYFEALSLRQRSDTLSDLKSAMGDAIQVVKAASAGIDTALAILDQMRSLINQANGSSDTATRSSLASQFGTLKTQLADVAGDSGYNGTNLLGTSTVNSLTVDFNEDGSSSITISGADASNGNYTVTNAVNNWAAANDVTAALDDVTDAITAFRSLASTLSSNMALVTTRQEFTASLGNVLTEGADNLTAADMNEEGANMLMLQTRQQLGTTALSLSAQAAASILRLF
jgi:flagellin-like hook-associated protein FlgL